MHIHIHVHMHMHMHIHIHMLDIPALASRIYDGNVNKEAPLINLQGVAIGNGV